MRTEDDIAKARSMAAEFAELRANDFLKTFLTDTGIADDLYKANSTAPGFNIEKERWVDLLVHDYRMNFAQGLALAYSLGFVDAKEHAPSKLYRKVEKKKDAGTETQLILPGLD